MTDTAIQTGTIRTKIPARLDRLPWSRFHWLIILGLGTAWILDGLEVTIVGTVASRMTEHGSGITITVAQIGEAGAIYVVGACTGALFFGQLTDRFGRKKLFIWTLGLYLVATAATGGAFNAWYFFAARFLTGAGIGGEYAAINSAIDELIPARARGRTDLVINGSYWVGSAAGSAASIALLNTAWLPMNIGWRIGFALGVILAIAVLIVRRHVPESPRWLFIHGREEEAEAIVADIEHGIEEETGEPLRNVDKVLTVRQRKTIPFREIAQVAYKVYPKRSILALALFVGQAFIYNGITFNLGTLMTTFYKVSSSFVPVFIILYAVANFAGPATIGRLFDTVGRKPMISGTYLGSAALGIILAVLFTGGALNKWTFIGVVMATFFLASAGASAAYLTASEIFPMETRALAIAFFYAIGTAVGGISGPLLFGNLIGSGNRGEVAVAFYIGSAVMAAGGITEIAFGIRAEQQQLEDIAKPLTVEDAEQEQEQEGRPGVEAGPEGDSDARHARTEAAQWRAQAAEHLAAMHQRRAAAHNGDPHSGEHAEEERVLAEVANLTAQAFDQEAVAAEERAETSTDQPEDTPAARAAWHRAQAAHSRAEALRADARARSATDPADSERQSALAEAAREQALAYEQRAEAELADSDQEERAEEVASAKRRLHEMWARFHEAQAGVYEAASEGEATGEPQAAAEVALEYARAAEAEVEAAEHRADARQEEQAAESARAEARRREEHERRLREQERIRARLRHARQAEHGLRRLRPGPGRVLSATPAIGSATPRPMESLDHEMSAIERVLRERGPLRRDQIRALVGARYWGPGVFDRAMAEAAAEGMIRRVGRNTYALGEEAGPPQEAAGQAPDQQR